MKLLQNIKMPQTLTWFLCMCLFCLVVYACANNAPKNTLSEDESKLVMDFPDFNEDSAYQYVKEQLAFGPRVPNSEAQKKCALYFERFFQNLADQTQVQSFTANRWDGEVLHGKNIIASFNLAHKNRILLAAHWDSRPYADYDSNPDNHRKPIDGANDGASGVAVLMEIARVLKIQKPSVGVDIILFDLEDSGEPAWSNLNTEDSWCLGAQHWALNPHKHGYKANFGILLDMVGSSNLRFTKEASSMYYAPDIVTKVWNIASSMGYANIFSSDMTGGILDDHIYVNKYAQIPMIDIIHYEARMNTKFHPTWHTMQDDIDVIDKKSLGIVGNVVLGVLFNE